jgi:hypothetical protein
MNTSMLLVILFFILVYQSYTTYSLKDKIFCTFRRRNQTRIEKWAKDKQSVISFDDGWYEIDPSRVILQLKWNPLPVWIRVLDFRFDSSKALDPKSFDNRYTPEQRKLLDTSDAIKGFVQGTQSSTQSGKTKAVIGGWLPIVIIIGFLIVGFMLWRQQSSIDKIGLGQNYIESTLSQLLQK